MSVEAEVFVVVVVSLFLLALLALLDVDDRRSSFAFSLVDHRRSDMVTDS